MDNQPVIQHFDTLAPLYDKYKRQNRIYYDSLKLAVKEFISKKDCTILDIGCGTGSMLSFLKPTFGLGIDNSQEMIRRAKQKYAGTKYLSFRVHDIEKEHISGKFDYILLTDVIEHLHDKEGAMNNIYQTMSRQTNLIVSMANPLWEPLLIFLEKLHLKMPEGPHFRISERDFFTLLHKHNLYSIRKKCYLPSLNIPILDKLSLIYVYEIKRSN